MTEMAPVTVVGSETSKTTVESAYPSPADEVKDSMIPPSPDPFHRRLSSPREDKTLPSLKEVLQQPMSPSTSPYAAPQPYRAPSSSYPISTPLASRTNGNAYADNYAGTADPQLFSDRVNAPMYRDQPLFPSSDGRKARRLPTTTSITSRTRKHAPQQAPLPSLLEPRREGLGGVWARVATDPMQWFRDRRDEDAVYWPSTGRAQRIERVVLDHRPTSQDTGAVATRPLRDGVGGQDSPMQAPRGTKRPRGPGSGHSGVRSSPREQPASSFFDTVLDNYVDKTPRQTPRKTSLSAPAAKKAKPSVAEPDRAYEWYNDTTPDVATLDKGIKFTASWSGKPLNLDHDPDRSLLHDEEIRLASKLALTCARYLYLKRRFYAGRLEFARKSQLYNINAAQQQCKGQDAFGIVGADVNKTSSMWKAFNSVGWLEPSLMKPYL